MDLETRAYKMKHLSSPPHPSPNPEKAGGERGRGAITKESMRVSISILISPPPTGRTEKVRRRSWGEGGGRVAKKATVTQFLRSAVGNPNTLQ